MLVDILFLALSVVNTLEGEIIQCDVHIQISEMVLA